MDQSGGGHAAQCFARLRSVGLETFPIPSESRRGYQERGVPSYTEMDEGRNKRAVNVPPIKVRILGKHTSALHFVVSIYLDQLDFEDQSGVCWDDRWETAGSICVVGRHRKPSFLTKRELGNPLVPALDHATDADLCNKRNVSVSTRIELLPIGECTHIVNCDSVATCRKGFVISSCDGFYCNAHGLRKKGQVGGSLKRDERDDDGESLYRKRGGVVVAAGNNDLDRLYWNRERTRFN